MDVDPKKLRGWARLLSTLLQTPDDELDDFARERLSKPDLDEAILAKGRELLFYVGRALEEPTEDRWKGLAYALKSIEQWEEGMKNDEAGANRAAGADGAAASPASSNPAPAPAAPTPAPSPAPSPLAFSPPAASPTPSPWSGGHTPSPRVAPGPNPAPIAQPPAAAPAPPAAAPAPPAAAPAPPPAAPATPIPRLDTPPVQGRDEAMALPFAGQAQAPPKISGLLGENPALGQTAYKPSQVGAGKKGPTMPFNAIPDMRPPTSDPIPLQTYAALCVERTLWPDNVAGRSQRFGLQPGDEERIDAHFKAKFAETPKRRMEWLQLCAQHKKTLGQG